MNTPAIFKATFTLVFLASAVASSGQYTPKQQVPTDAQVSIPTIEELNWFFENDLELSSYNWTDPVLNQQLQSVLRHKKRARRRGHFAIGFFAAAAATGLRALTLKRRCGGNEICNIFLTDAFSSMALASGGIGLVFLASSGTAKAKSIKQLDAAKSRYSELNNK